MEINYLAWSPNLCKNHKWPKHCYDLSHGHQYKVVGYSCCSFGFLGSISRVRQCYFFSNWLIFPPVHCSIIIDQLFGEKSPLVVESVRLPGAGDGSLPPWFVNVELADPANCLQSSGSRDPGFWILDPWSMEPAKCLLVISGPKTLFLFCLGD